MKLANMDLRRREEVVDELTVKITSNSITSFEFFKVQQLKKIIVHKSVLGHDFNFVALKKIII